MMMLNPLPASWAAMTQVSIVSRSRSPRWISLRPYHYLKLSYSPFISEKVHTLLLAPAQKKIVWETSLGQSLGKSLGVLEKSLA